MTETRRAYMETKWVRNAAVRRCNGVFPRLSVLSQRISGLLQVKGCHRSMGLLVQTQRKLNWNALLPSPPSRSPAVWPALRGTSQKKKKKQTIRGCDLVRKCVWPERRLYNILLCCAELFTWVAKGGDNRRRNCCNLTGKEESEAHRYSLLFYFSPLSRYRTVSSLHHFLLAA